MYLIFDRLTEPFFIVLKLDFGGKKKKEKEIHYVQTNFVQSQNGK